MRQRLDKALGFVGWVSLILVILVILMNLGATMSGAQTMSSPSSNWILAGGTIYVSPTEEPIHDGVVLIRDGSILDVGARGEVDQPNGVEIIDCAGKILTAGFWNSHVHFFERKWAEASSIPASELERQLEEMLTQYGFTSVFDTGSTFANTQAIRQRIESGEIRGPRIRSTGEALIAPEAMPSETILRVLGFLSMEAPEVLDAAEARAAARNLLKSGADGIKIHLQPPPAPGTPMPVEAIEAAVSEAHRDGKPAFAHPNTAEHVQAALDAGVDIIAHTTPGSGPWDDTLIASMQGAGVSVTPTLTLWKSFLRHDRVSVQEQMVGTAVNQLRAWLEAEGEVLFGTDLGAVDYDPSEEYALMAEAGMSFRQILDSLTTAPANRFGESERLGRIAPGLAADIVVLSTDPSKDILAFADVAMTLRGGRLAYRRDDDDR